MSSYHAVENLVVTCEMGSCVVHAWYMHRAPIAPTAGKNVSTNPARVAPCRDGAVPNCFMLFNFLFRERALVPLHHFTNPVYTKA